MKHEGTPQGKKILRKSPPCPDETAEKFGRHRFGGLSGKLLILTVLFVMLAEVLIYVPSIANFRNNWLMDRVTTAGVAASVLAETNTVAPRIQDELLNLTGALAIALDQGSQRTLIAMSDVPGEVEFVFDMGRITPLSSVLSSFKILTYSGDGSMRIIGVGQMGRTERVDLVLPIALLQQDMLAFSGRILALSLVISAITAFLVYITLRAVFIRPLRRLTLSMERFAENPEDPSLVIPLSGRRDELGDAEIRLAAMEEALSRALHQKQRLADLGLAVSKINHDLRNLLASAQLFLERLELVEDPTVSRVAPKILATLDRAVGYTQAVMSYGKAQERPPEKRLLSLKRVAEDVADVLGLAEHESVAFENKVPEQIEINADPEQIFRVLMNLVRNALQALEAEKDGTLIRRITIEAEHQASGIAIKVRDTGPGIPQNIKSALFKAFHSGSKAGGIGLGLAIVAELLKAHGGSIHLDDKSSDTCFCLIVPHRSAK